MNMIRQLFGPAPSTLDAVSPTPQPAPQAAPQAAAGSDSLAQMLRLMSGDLSSLGTADKLMALSGLLRSATRSGRRAGLTPQQVLGQVQQQQLQRIQGRMQVEQLRAAEEQSRRERETIQQYSQTLPEEQRAAFTALPREQQFDIISKEFEAPKFEKTVERNGEVYAIFDKGPPQKLDLPAQANYRQIDDGQQILIFDENNMQAGPIRIIEKKPSFESIASQNRSRVVTTRQGVYLINPISGKVIRKLGDPTAINFFNLGGTGEEEYDSEPGE